VTEALPSQRLDLWLWYSRLCKTRSLAARLCAAGRVELRGMVVLKPAQPVRPGDLISLDQGRERVTLRVEALGQRRGPAHEARALYRETAPRTRLTSVDPDWIPLLAGDGAEAHLKG
jgi:ribosome-associated heat shock protein Hsp15